MRGASARQVQAGQTHRASDAPQRRCKRSCHRMTVWRRCGDDAVSGRCFDAAAESSAGVRLADSCSARAAAFGSAAPAAAARCEAGRRNCCNDPAARFPRAASGRAPDNPDSNTAPSNRADIAFVCLARPTAPAAEGESDRRRSAPTAKTPRNWRDCAPEGLVSQGKSIQLVVVLLQSCGKYGERKSGSACGRWHLLRMRFNWLAK